jgi:hypothetical protein
MPNIDSDKYGISNNIAIDEYRYDMRDRNDYCQVEYTID